jgi:tetratricopeptide (TPR) repeat protein
MMSTAYEKAQELAAQGKNQAALFAFEEAFRQEPGNYKAIFGAGLMHQRLGEHADAISAFSRVIKMATNISSAYYSRALSHQRLERWDEALVDIEMSLKLEPNDIDALYARGLSLKHLNRHAEAIDAFSNVLARAGTYAPAWDARAKLRYLSGDYEGAIQDFTAAIEAGLDGYGVRLFRGLANYSVGRHGEALEDLSRAISLQPHLPGTYARRALVYRALNDDKSEAKDFAKFQELVKAADHYDASQSAR